MAHVTKGMLMEENVYLKKDSQRIRDSHAEWVSADERRRKEFARAFRWVKDGLGYVMTGEHKTPSWEEIFVKVGKLLVYEGMNNMVGEVNQLKELVCKLSEELQNHITKE